MDPGNQPQPQAAPHGLLYADYTDYTGYPFHEYVPTPVEPCSPLCNGPENLYGPFHLLSCGHIVILDEQDKRCGLNCQHTSSSTHTNGVMNSYRLISSEAYGAPSQPLAPISATQFHDTLYCEICNGIPFERYIIMRPAEDPYNPLANNPTRLRRCFALTRQLLESLVDLNDEQVNALLCRPFFNPSHEAFDWKDTHFLRCGHEVWCAPTRPCASNCHDEPQCRGRIFPRNGKQNDVILCQECVARAELVYARYERLCYK